MSSALRITLLADGSSDNALLYMIRWLLRRRGFSRPIDESWADLRRLRKPPKTLAERIRAALLFYPCDMLFVHRDAEGANVQWRLDEIRAAMPPGSKYVPVVPVKMFEAWLLFNEDLIRAAAGNPRGRAAIDLPPLNRVESLADPKERLFSLLRMASGLKGRRLQRFNEAAARRRVAELAPDFSPLLELKAFEALDHAIGIALAAPEDWSG